MHRGPGVAGGHLDAVVHEAKPYAFRGERVDELDAVALNRRIAAAAIGVNDDRVSVLERRGMQVLTAGTGYEAIATLADRANVAIVLMDIMMPEMDGYQTMQAIRQKPSLRRLPIIALTAKAMKGDREKCLDAGASDYLAKPVNTEQLLSALRMWLHR